MIRASIAYSNAGHARIQELSQRHNIAIVELIESMAFADDEIVKSAIAQGLSRRKTKMAEAKKTIRASMQILKTVTPEELAQIVSSRHLNA